MNHKTQKIINETTEDLRELVQTIESLPETTKYHYGNYLSLLSDIASPEARMITTLSLIRAGANKSGVLRASRILGDI